MKDMMDLHTHTVASGHAYNSLYEMVRSAADHGVTLFGCSEHAPAMPGTCHAYHFINYKVIPRTLSGITVLMGVELNIIDFEGGVDLGEDILVKLDYAIASLHPPCLKPGTMEQNTRAYLKVMENPLIQIIGHPDDGRYAVDYDAIVSAAARHRKLLEVNSSSLHPQSGRQNARENYIEMLKLCRKYNAPILIGSDAHIAEDTGNHRDAHLLLEELDFPEELVVNTSPEKLALYLPKVQSVCLSCR